MNKQELAARIWKSANDMRSKIVNSIEEEKINRFKEKEYLLSDED